MRDTRTTRIRRAVRLSVTVAATTIGGSEGLKVDFALPTNCVLYAERLHFQTSDGEEIAPSYIPTPTILVDKATGHEKKLYDRNFRVFLKPMSGDLVVKFQGCTNAACYFPEKRVFQAVANGQYVESSASAPSWSQ